ncbi:Malonate decarboxylase gamma subunit (MdcE) [compost metagenome]
MVHAMGKAAAARITLRSVDELEVLAAKVPPMAYDLENYASLGLLWDRVAVGDAERPSAVDLGRVHECLVRAVEDIGSSSVLGGRLGAEHRAASSKVREMLRAQW